MCVSIRGWIDAPRLKAAAPGKLSMKIDVLTLFPEMFAGPFDASIVRRAIDRGLISIALHNLREWTHDPRRTVDDNRRQPVEGAGRARARSARSAAPSPERKRSFRSAPMPRGSRTCPT